MIELLFAPVKVPENVAPFRRISVSLQAGMAIAEVKRHATSADLALILVVLFIRNPLLESCGNQVP
jgi:hypothetical protein